MTKAQRLAVIAKQIKNLTQSPLYSYRKENSYHAVPGEGNPNAELMFIGEAPGAQEATSGRPFVGRAGQYLDSLLEENGLKRKEVFITNIVKDRPPGNRDPSKLEIQLYTPFLIQQIDIIQPKVIATLGRFSMDFMIQQYHLSGNGEKIGQLHGKLLSGQANFGKINVFPLYHPAAVFYNRKLEPFMQEDFHRLVGLL
jgi:uracil-DNA glycosylase